MPAQSSDERESLAQIGQRAHHCIAAAQKHDIRSTNLWLSAGMVLNEAKGRVDQERGYGHWIAWLLEHKISDRTARKAMEIARADNPMQAAEAERARCRDKDRKARAARSSVARATEVNSAPPSNVTSITRAKRPPLYAELSPDGKRKADEYIANLYREERGPKLLTNS